MTGTLSPTGVNCGPNTGTGVTSDSDDPTLTSIPSLVTVAVTTAGTEVTAGGGTDVVATPEVHTTVISNVSGAREIALETFPGVRFAIATLTHKETHKPDQPEQHPLSGHPANWHASG